MTNIELRDKIVKIFDNNIDDFDRDIVQYTNLLEELKNFLFIAKRNINVNPRSLCSFDTLAIILKCITIDEIITVEMESKCDYFSCMSAKQLLDALNFIISIDKLLNKEIDCKTLLDMKDSEIPSEIFDVCSTEKSSSILNGGNVFEKKILSLGFSTDYFFNLIFDYQKLGTNFEYAMLYLISLRSYAEDFDEGITVFNKDKSYFEKSPSERNISMIFQHIKERISSLKDKLICLNMCKTSLISARKVFIQKFFDGCVDDLQKTFFDGLDNLLFDDEKIVLDFISSTLDSEYEDLLVEYEDLKKDKVLQIQKLLSQYSITPEMYSVIDFANVDFLSISDMCQMLSKMEFPVDIMLQVLKFSNVDRVRHIYKLCSDGVLPFEFVSTNFKILCNDELFKRITDNILTFTDNGYNPRLLNASADSLLIESGLFKKNFEVLSRYGLSKSIKRDKKFGFLGNGDLELLLDKIIELGFFEYLAKDIDLLNYDLVKWKRVEVLQNAAFSIDSKEELLEYFNKSFCISDNMIDEYIYSSVDSKINYMLSHLSDDGSRDNLSNLDGYDDFKGAYSISGIRVSKEKVRRNMNKLKHSNFSFSEKLYASIINNMNLSSEQCSVIKSVISGSDGLKLDLHTC